MLYNAKVSFSFLDTGFDPSLRARFQVMAMLTEEEVDAGDLSTLVCPMLPDFKEALKCRKGERPANGFIRKLFLSIYPHLNRRIQAGGRQVWFIPIKDTLPPAVDKKDVAQAMVQQQHPTIRQVTDTHWYVNVKNYLQSAKCQPNRLFDF